MLSVVVGSCVCFLDHMLTLSMTRLNKLNEKVKTWAQKFLPVTATGALGSWIKFLKSFLLEEWGNSAAAIGSKMVGGREKWFKMCETFCKSSLVSTLTGNDRDKLYCLKADLESSRN